MELVIAYPNEDDFPKGSQEYKDRLNSFRKPLQAGKVLVFERPHRMLGYTKYRIVTEWKFYPGTEDLVGIDGSCAATWDSATQQRPRAPPTGPHRAPGHL